MHAYKHTIFKLEQMSWCLSATVSFLLAVWTNKSRYFIRLVLKRHGFESRWSWSLCNNCGLVVHIYRV